MTKKITILYSGGLDSLIMAKYAEVNYPDAEVTKLFFDIGQDYVEKELAALPDDVIVKKLDWLGADVTATSKEDSDNHSGNIFIPGRNMALAVMAACQTLPDEIWMGALMGEVHDQATDKNFKFTKELSEVMSYVLSPFKKDGVKVRFPLAEAGFGKWEATEWAVDNGVSEETIKSSSSCLSGEEGNCGQCVVCLRRWGIFHRLEWNEEKYNKHPVDEMSDDNLAMVRSMLEFELKKSDSTHYDEYRRREILPALVDYFGDPEITLLSITSEIAKRERNK